MTKAIVLLSGGLDSATCLYWALSQGYRAQALLFDYGQRHKREIQSAQNLARRAKTPFQLVRFKLPWGGSSLLDPKAKLPSSRSYKQMSRGIPSTYVPARNTIFLSFALSLADAQGARAIVIGANAVDFSGYPDCRPDYMRSFQKTAALGTQSGSEGRAVRILAPLIKMSKSQIIRLGLRLKVPYDLTWSCYGGGSRPCGRCDSCLLRRKGFEEAGAEDPLS